jgi:hypothetical protein
VPNAIEEEEAGPNAIEEEEAGPNAIEAETAGPNTIEAETAGPNGPKTNPLGLLLPSSSLRLLLLRGLMMMMMTRRRRRRRRRRKKRRRRRKRRRRTTTTRRTETARCVYVKGSGRLTSHDKSVAFAPVVSLEKNCGSSFRAGSRLLSAPLLFSERLQALRFLGRLVDPFHGGRTGRGRRELRRILVVAARRGAGERKGARPAVRRRRGRGAPAAKRRARSIVRHRMVHTDGRMAGTV